MRNKLYITFPTTFDALGSEKLLKDKGFLINLVPVPREISAGCGFSVSAPPEMEEELKKVLMSSDFEFEEFIIL